MTEEAMIAAVVAIVAGAVAWTTRPGLPRAVVWTGMVIIVAAWVPLLLAVWLDSGRGNPIGLGLLAWFGSGLGLILVILGLLLRLGQWLWRPKA